MVVGAASVEVLPGLSIRHQLEANVRQETVDQEIVSKQVILMRHDLKMRRGKQIA